MAKDIKLKEVEIEGKLPRKRQSRKEAEIIVKTPQEQQVETKQNSLKVKNLMFKRRKTALPSEIKNSFAGTPYAIKEIENIEIENRRVTRNMKKAKKEVPKNSNSEDKTESVDDNLSQEQRKESLQSKKKLLKYIFVNI